MMREGEGWAEDGEIKAEGSCAEGKEQGIMGGRRAKGMLTRKKEKRRMTKRKKMGGSQTVVTHTFKLCCLSLEMTAVCFIISTLSCLSSDLIENN